ncbi:hypothetical protein K0M31_007551 [Melipona bicolor]|uniref:Uncharacterized protein n=1 Tax=Melipona bicolor TaxID=60889 RepID=A0AA40GCH1_9HYME|nr:hypothetical protein K0M31_007551 [Melipona bicolor]
MLYMKEMRAKVVAECTLKESAAINQILGRRNSNWFLKHLAVSLIAMEKLQKCVRTSPDVKEKHQSQDFLPCFFDLLPNDWSSTDRRSQGFNKEPIS